MTDYLILIILHLIGDFYFQSTKVARCKNAKTGKFCGDCKEKCNSSSWCNWKYLLIHSLLYIVPFCVLYFIMEWESATVIIIVLLITHLLIDLGTCYFNKKTRQTVVFILDQLLHIGVLCTILRVLSVCYDLSAYYKMLKIVFLGLMLIMPCSIMINKLFNDIYPDSDDEKGIFDIGSMIGIMERILTVIFASFGNYPAIAIIITVKTWARTNDLQELEFRNKYLLGTLTSLVLALLIFIGYKML